MFHFCLMISINYRKFCSFKALAVALSAMLLYVSFLNNNLNHVQPYQTQIVSDWP